MASFLQSFLSRINPPPLADTTKAATGFAYGATAVPLRSVRDTVGQPHDTDHAILYALYQLNTDVSACVNRWARGVVSSGWTITTMDPDQKRTRNLNRLIDETNLWIKNPHPSKQIYLLLYELVQHLAISGDAFWHIIRDPKTDRVIELAPLHPTTMRVIADEHGVVTGYLQQYQGQRVLFDAEDIAHIHLPNPTNDLYGQPPMALALEEAGLDLQALRSNRAIFENGLKPSAAILLNDATAIDPEQAKRAKELIKQQHTGANHHHGLMVLGGVKDLKPYSQTLKDMEFLGLRDLSTSKVTSAYGIPKMLLGYHNAGDYATARVLMADTYFNTFKPLQEMIAEVITEKILHAISPDLRFTFNQPDFSDPEQKRKDLLAAEARGIIKKNEVRTHAFALDPIDGLDDEPDPPAPPPAAPDRQQQDDTDTTDEAQEAPQKAAKRVIKALTQHEIEAIRTRRETLHDELEAAIEPTVVSYFERQEGRYLDKLAVTFKSTRSAVKKGVLDSLIATYFEGTDDDDRELSILLFGELAPSLQAGANETQLQISFSLGAELQQQIVDDYLLKNALAHAKGINDTTKNQLRDALRQGIADGEGIPELRARVKSIFTNASTARANTIARTETAQAFEYANQRAMVESGVVTAKRWLSARDSRVRPAHQLLEGKVVPLNEKFPSLNGLIDPGEEIACRCTSIGIVEGE